MDKRLSEQVNLCGKWLQIEETAEYEAMRVLARNQFDKEYVKLQKMKMKAVV